MEPQPKTKDSGSTEAPNKASRASRYAATVIALFCLWILLTSTVSDEFLAGTVPPGAGLQEIIAGALLSLVIAFWGYRYLTVRGLASLAPGRILRTVFYIPIFFYECFKANIDVAYRVIHPRMPINPGIVVIKTTLKSDLGKLLLANSITLTPGTLTVDVWDDYLFIHWINVKSEDVEEATRLIAGRFERHLKVIAE